VSSAERKRQTVASVSDRAIELDDDDRAWLARRLEEYKHLLAYLREH
jgi:hypothetical protein